MNSSKKKLKTVWQCQQCADTFAKWSGRCPSCGAWSALTEVENAPAAADKRGIGKALKAVKLEDVKAETRPRWRTGMEELDRVLGGGIVPGSLTLIGGDPGIGKSTLLLQMMANLAAAGLSVLYVSGEESPEQIKIRSSRLQIPCAELLLLAETSLSKVLAEADRIKPDVLVVDSIQTVYKEDLPGSPGSVTQLRDCALALMVQAKTTNMATFMVGHVTKEGQIAGPRVLEHMVDTVAYFEGERHHAYRILRAVKNRFGATNEIGVFEMANSGLIQVGNPSQVFLQQGGQKNPGSAVTCALEGSRPILLEVQALVSRSNYSVPQRVCTGFEPKRLTIILALMEKFAGIEIGIQDVFVSVAGGLRVEEPAVDLSAAAAVVSSHLGKYCKEDMIMLGELGLGGELRPVPQMENRLREARRLGFNKAVIPAAGKAVRIEGMECLLAPSLQRALDQILD